MTEKKAFSASYSEDKTASYILSYISSIGNTSYLSAATCTILAALLYLKKRHALVIKKNNEIKTGNVFLSINAKDIQGIRIDVSKQNDTYIQAIHLCSTLPNDDVLYDVVNRTLLNLSHKGIPSAATKILEGILDESVSLEDSIEAIEGLQYGMGRLNGDFMQPKEL